MEKRELPWRSILAGAFALVYFLSPIDLIPDFIPFIGYVDDAAVIALVIRMIRKDLARRRALRAAPATI